MPVAARSRKQVSDRSITGISGSNPSKCMDDLPMCLLYVV